MILPDTATIAASIFGGALIGLSAAGLLLINGRIAGISGILGGAVLLKPGLWRWAFLAGLIASPFVASFAGIARVVPTHQGGLIVLVIAGLLVGFGTRLSSGCTSGHGVCGLANLSLRSLIATVVFIAVAIGTVFLVRHAHLPLPQA